MSTHSDTNTHARTRNCFNIASSFFRSLFDYFSSFPRSRYVRERTLLSFGSEVGSVLRLLGVTVGAVRQRFASTVAARACCKHFYKLSCYNFLQPL